MHRGGRVTYRAFDGGVEFLEVDNHVDLNVLVVEAALLREVGGFAEDLRRAVDYDLVLRLARRVPCVHVPVVGAVYRDDSDEAADADRISVREPVAWNSVVRARHAIDWDAQVRRPRVAGRVSVVVPFTGAPGQVRACVASLLDDAPVGPGAPDLEVLLVDRGSARADGLAARVLTLADPRVRVHRVPADHGVAVALAHALPVTTGEVVALVDPAVRWREGGLAPLLAALGEEVTAAVQPAACAPDGTVAAAGLTSAPGAGLPVPVLPGHHLDDLRAAGERVDVAALDGPVWLARAADLLAVRGLDALLERSWGAAELSLRLAGLRGGRLVVVPTAVVDAGPELAGEPSDATAAPGSGRHDDRVFAQRWAAAGAEGPPVWEAAGYRLAHVEADIDEGAGRHRLRAVLVRRSADPGTLRWAVKLTDRDEGRADLADRVVRALRAAGHVAVVDQPEAMYRATSRFDDVELVLGGNRPVLASLARPALLWLSEGAGAGAGEEAGYRGVLAGQEWWDDGPVGVSTLVDAALGRR
ncbi:MAG: glycosyltransferase [Kineosporiaceae bacterium]